MKLSNSGKKSRLGRVVVQWGIDVCKLKSAKHKWDGVGDVPLK